MVAEKFEKMSKIKLLSSFQLAKQILTFQPIKANFVYEVLRNYPKINEFLFLEPAVKPKVLTFALQTEKRLVVLFWTFFSNISATKAN